MTTRQSASMDANGLLGPLEYEVMQALWHAAPATVNTVRDRINQSRGPAEQLAYTTVMTVLARLHDKALAEREKVGRGYAYTPRFDEPGLVEHLGHREVSELVDRYGPVALAQFAAALQDADPALLDRVTRLAAGADDA